MLIEITLATIITYSQHIRPIMENRCFRCHSNNQDAIHSVPNLTTYESAYANRYKILEKVVTREEMPPRIPMFDEERELIKKWVKSGAQK